jgi:hypothetical protein
LKIIMVYFPALTYAIVVLGVAYFIYRRNWKTDPSVFLMRLLVFLVLIILFAALDVIALMTPILAGPAWVDSLPQLLMWIWPDIVILVALVVDLSRILHLWTAISQFLLELRII